MSLEGKLSALILKLIITPFQDVDNVPSMIVKNLNADASECSFIHIRPTPFFFVLYRAINDKM